MSRRALCLGILATVFIAGFCYFHDCVMNSQAAIRLVPHLLPFVIYGGLILALLLLNPLIRWLRPTSVLSAKELAVVTALGLAACSIPFYGLVHCWPSALMLPHHFHNTTPGWQQREILETVPEKMLCDTSVDDGDSLTAYVTGMASGDEWIPLRRIPWGAWRRTLLFWTPLVLSITLGMVGLSRVVHRQWSRHEQLPYPISRFAHALLPGEGDAFGEVFRQRAFQVAALVVLLIHMNNYLHAWWPTHFIPIRMRLDFSPLIQLLPQIISGDGRSLFYPRIMFAVVGIAFFFSSDVSLSLAITPFVMCYLTGVLTGYGVSVTKGFSLFHNTKIFLYMGGYTGVFLMAAYTGRFYYWHVLRRSLCLPSDESMPGGVVWGMRVFLVGSLLFTLQLCLVGLDWPFAVLYTGIAVMVFTVVSRAVAETGAFYVGTWILPGAVLWGFCGARAIGPESMAMMILVSCVVLIGPGWAPMPFVVQSLRLADLSRVNVTRIAIGTGAVLVLALAIALPATIYLQYRGGVMTTSSGWARYTPRLPFDQAMDMTQRLDAQGVLEESRELRGLGRLKALSPDPTFVAAFVIGTVLAVTVSLCRLRFPWWPLHPIVFVFFGSHQAQRLAFSFLLGWLVKTAVCRYGGDRMHRACKPIMLGLIAGEVMAGTIPVIVGIVYYAVTGRPAVHFSLLL